MSQEMLNKRVTKQLLQGLCYVLQAQLLDDPMKMWAFVAIGLQAFWALRQSRHSSCELEKRMVLVRAAGISQVGATALQQEQSPAFPMGRS